MLVLKDKEALASLLVHRFDQEDPELFKPLATCSHLEVVLDNYVKDVLVVGWRTLEGEHTASIVVSLPEHVVSRNSSASLILATTSLIDEEAETILVEVIRILRVHAHVLDVSKVLAATVPI